MDPRNHRTGIILAGGQSSRLGTDKGLIRLGGKTLAERAIEILSPFCSEILISSSNQEYQKLLQNIIPDIQPGKGPMMGLYSSLLASANSQNFVLAVDNVLVTGSFFEYLLNKNLHGYDCALSFIKHKFHEPLVGFYHKSILETMNQMLEEGNNKLPDLFKKVKVLSLPVETDFPAWHPDYFRSLNSETDLEFFSSSIPS